MRKISILIAVFLVTVNAMSQKPNPTIGKKETEITSFIMGAGFDLVYGGQLVYRVSALKKLKIGAGILYGANSDVDGFSTTWGYGAVFADAVQFLGHRQKWSFGGQLGHGFHNRDNGGYSELKPGIYYSISANYRAIISKKLLFTTSLLTGYRNFHNKYGNPEDNFGFTGLRFGIVF